MLLGLFICNFMRHNLSTNHEIIQRQPVFYQFFCKNYI
jgi:hypothetical protein